MLAVVVGVGDALRLAVLVCDTVGVTEGEGVTEGCVKHVLLAASHTAYCAVHVQKDAPDVLVAPTPHAVHTRFGYTRPLLNWPAPQKHCVGSVAPAKEAPPFAQAVHVAAPLADQKFAGHCVQTLALAAEK